MSQFDELLAQLNAEQEEQSTLAKAIPAEGGEDDEAIQAAAAEGAEGEESETTTDEEEEGGEQSLTKSMVIDGEEVQVMDADQLIKSLQDLTGRVDEQESALTKALTSMVETMKSQGELIKSLQGQIRKLGTQGAGRKTVLNVLEKPDAGTQLAKSMQPEGLTPAEVLAKAHAAFDANKITGLELTTIDVSLRSGQPINQALLAKALA